VDLIEHLIKDLNLTREQAEGGAGVLLQIARDRLAYDEFVTIADSIPAISDILEKAPEFRIPPRRVLLPQLSRLLGGQGSLAAVKPIFEKLGMSKTSIRRFAEVLTSFFRQQGGAEIEAMLLRVLR